MYYGVIKYGWGKMICCVTTDKSKCNAIHILFYFITCTGLLNKSQVVVKLAPKNIKELVLQKILHPGS